MKIIFKRTLLIFLIITLIIVISGFSVYKNQFGNIISKKSSIKTSIEITTTSTHYNNVSDKKMTMQELINPVKL